jgi:hypothetical protein
MHLQVSIRRYAIFVLLYAWVVNLRICYNTRNISRKVSDLVPNSSPFLYSEKKN